MNHMRDVEATFAARGRPRRSHGPYRRARRVRRGRMPGAGSKAGRCRMRLQPLAGESSELITTPPANPPWPGALSVRDSPEAGGAALRAAQP